MNPWIRELRPNKALRPTLSATRHLLGSLKPSDVSLSAAELSRWHSAHPRGVRRSKLNDRESGTACNGD